MKIEAEKSKYHGDVGWESDPQLFAEVAVTWKKWLGEAGEHLFAAQILLPYVQEHHLQIERLMQMEVSGSIKIPPSMCSIYFLHCAFALAHIIHEASDFGVC